MTSDGFILPAKQLAVGINTVSGLSREAESSGVHVCMYVCVCVHAHQYVERKKKYVEREGQRDFELWAHVDTEADKF